MHCTFTSCCFLESEAAEHHQSPISPIAVTPPKAFRALSTAVFTNKNILPVWCIDLPRHRPSTTDLPPDYRLREARPLSRFMLVVLGVMTWWTTVGTVSGV